MSLPMCVQPQPTKLRLNPRSSPSHNTTRRSSQAEALSRTVRGVRPASPAETFNVNSASPYPGCTTPGRRPQGANVSWKRFSVVCRTVSAPFPQTRKVDKSRFSLSPSEIRLTQRSKMKFGPAECVKRISDGDKENLDLSTLRVCGNG